ncbi:MAG: O-antigen ligase family protein [Flavobacteriales bacterium]|nr:O-antigen ligase family protein [Flavobacteriales bacterium]
MGLLDLLFKTNSPVKKWLNHRNLYLLGLAVIICGLSWSNALMSIGQFIITGNWLIEFDFKKKLLLLKNSPLIWILILSFLLHVVGLLWTEEFNYALKDLRVKLPLLTLPVIIGTSNRLSLKEWKSLLIIYCITLFSLTIASYGKYLGIWGEMVIDKRQLSIYISHIRYGLNIALLIGLLFYVKPFKKGFLNWVLCSWFLISLLVFQLYTGLAILSILIFVFCIRILLLNLSNKPLRFGISSFILLVLFSLCTLIYQTKEDYYTELQLDYDQYDIEQKRSPNGELYWVDVEDLRTENGVLIRRFIAWKEIEREWNKRSEINFKDKDLRGQLLDQTLNRFLSSKGLKKDSIGISKLSEREIRAIEQGVANTYYLEHNALQNRIYKSIFELEEYKRTANASGFSLAMRYEFWRTAESIISQNFWLGTGTGDIGIAFKNEYVKQESKLDEVFRRRSHNQYLTAFATFGILGLCFFLMSTFLPAFYSIPNKQVYFFFLAMLCISFLTEDTLETQAGVTLFAFFNSLFVLGLNNFSDSQPNND